MGVSGTARLHHGRCLDVLREMDDHSVDVVVTDPPYGLAAHSPKTVTDAVLAWCSGDRERVPDGRGFLSREWDTFVPPPAVFDELARVLKPGGHAVVFAHARTQDLMGLSARLAGFELRDTLAWVNSKGMPKGTRLKHFVHRLGERYAGYATDLKPGYEPILLLRAPLSGTVPDTVERYGTGALNVGATRLRFTNDADRRGAEAKNAHARFGSAPRANSILGDASMIKRTDYDGSAGRLAANVVLSEEAAAELDAQSGIKRSYASAPRTGRRSDSDVYGGGRSGFGSASGPEYSDVGGASRFFYCPKAGKNERPLLEDGSGHVSVKPRALMDWLVTLTAPPVEGGAVVLDPFAGTSTTLAAAAGLGHHAIGIEEDPHSVELSRVRFATDCVELSVLAA